MLNGILLPIILFFILLLIRDQRLVGDLKNTRLYNVLGWGTFGLITLAVVVMLTSQLFEAFGLHLFGAQFYLRVTSYRSFDNPDESKR